MAKKSVALVITLVLCFSFMSCSKKSEEPPVETSPADDLHFADIGDLYLTKLPMQTRPANLLVLIFNYNNGHYVDSDAKIEQLWSDYIFGTGTRENETASINDYYREISYGKFYFNPILIGGNTTGVYSFHLDKDYSDDQGRHAEWPFFEFNYDMMGALESLAEKGLDPAEFEAEGVNHQNYFRTLVDYWDAPQWEHNPQWYSTSKILCVFPPYNMEQVGWTPLSYAADSFSLYAHVNQDSSWGTIAHELAHTLGTIDVYNFGSYYSDLMSAYTADEYGAAHINPFYKIVFGWIEPDIITASSTVTLFPATSDRYRPVIIPTSDPNQYYIIENRASEKFDSILGDFGYESINVWRIDKFGCEAIYPINSPRKGITLEGVLCGVNDSIRTKLYANYDDIKATSEIPGVTVTFHAKNADGSIEVMINI